MSKAQCTVTVKIEVADRKPGRTVFYCQHLKGHGGAHLIGNPCTHEDGEFCRAAAPSKRRASAR